MSANAIPLEWIKVYVDQLLEAAGRLEPGGFRDAVLNRADTIMDLVKAWKDRPR